MSITKEYGFSSAIIIDYMLPRRADPVLESISVQAILRSVHAGLGISFLPDRLARPHIVSGLVSTCRVIDESFIRNNYLVWHRQKFLTNSAKKLMQLFRERAVL